VNHRIVAALVVALLAVSCTPDQPDENEMGKDGKGSAEPPITAQRPVDKISTNFEFKCPPTPISCPVSIAVRRSHRRETEALVGQLRQDKPSWLRYVKAVEISSWVPGPLAGDTKLSPQYYGAEGDRELLVQTGIWYNEPGKDIGAEICLAMLEDKLDTVTIYGISGEWQVGLARCQ
jgi:hypothetical protein